MGPLKQLNRVIHKIADRTMFWIVGDDSTYIYNVSWRHSETNATHERAHATIKVKCSSVWKSAREGLGSAFRSAKAIVSVSDFWLTLVSQEDPRIDHTVLTPNGGADVKYDKDDHVITIASAGTC
eukprot:3037988-Rhodomonas_salina.2